jgi:hypothetical protein
MTFASRIRRAPRRRRRAPDHAQHDDEDPHGPVEVALGVDLPGPGDVEELEDPPRTVAARAHRQGQPAEAVRARDPAVPQLDDDRTHQREQEGQVEAAVVKLTIRV